MKSSDSELDNAATQPHDNTQAAPSDPVADALKNRRMASRARRQAVAARVFETLSTTMGRMTWAGCRRTGMWMGLLFYNGVRWRRDATIASVQLAFPGIGQTRARQIARRSAQNICMTLCEFLHLRTASAREVREYVDFESFEHIPTVLKQGHGFIMLSAHFGNWELVAARSALEFPLTVVARQRSNSALQECFSEVRRAAGVQEILKFNAARAAVRLLQNNSVVGLLPDEYAWRDGILLPMFGQPTRFTIAPARLALMGHSPLIPIFGVRRTPWLSDGRIIARVSPPLYFHSQPGQRDAVVHESTGRIIEQIENIVREYPEQWLWPHDRWKAEDMEPTQ